MKVSGCDETPPLVPQWKEQTLMFKIIWHFSADHL